MRLAPIAVLACTVLLAFAASASAQNFVVTTTADNSGPCNPGNCSVREALAAADANTGEDTVTIPAGHYVLTQGELLVNADEVVNIVGHSARDTILDGGGNSRVLNFNEGDPHLSHLTITGGHSAEGQGGGIFFDGNLMTADHIAVVGNTAAPQADFGGQGGGIFGDEAVTLTNSVVSGNVADGTGSTFSGGQGGGIFGNEALVMTNVTVSGNKALAAPGATFPDGQGGGIFVNEQGTVFTNVTIAGNDAAGADEGGGVFVNDDMTFQNTIVAGNTAAGAVSDCFVNDVISGDHNLESAADCGFTAAGDRQNANPLLGALGNNGGETDTQALGAGSPALDTAGASCPGTDQRDVPRPQFAGCDIGAFELAPAAAAAPPPPAPPAAPADKTKPKITIAGVRAACISRNISIRVRASDASGVKSTRITLDGKRLHAKSKTRFTLKVNVKKLRPGRHVLRVTTTDGAGNRTTKRRTITRCAKPAAKPKRQSEPRFTG